LVQVARPPGWHVVWPWEHVSLQVAEHMAFGAIPEHESGVVHGVADAT
jgi:hypothetical protein